MLKEYLTPYTFQILVLLIVILAVVRVIQNTFKSHKHHLNRVEDWKNSPPIPIQKYKSPNPSNDDEKIWKITYRWVDYDHDEVMIADARNINIALDEADYSLSSGGVGYVISKIELAED